MNLGTARVIHGNALNLLLDGNSVDLVVTSPPYFGLRSYQDGGEHYAGQIGSEATPKEFVDALIAATREMVRVVKPSASIFINLGDKYAGGGGQWDKDERPDPGRRRAVSGKIGSGGNTYGLRAKSLIGIPWRYALRCIDDLGLILRAEIIWSKPNGLPESVTDRVRRSHEQWFHFTLNPQYYSAVDEIRESYAPGTAARYAAGYKSNGRTEAGQQSTPSIPLGVEDLTPNSLGKLPGSVWSVPTQPLQVPPELGVDHFAAFPLEMPRRIITGWSPREVCTVCGQGRRPVTNVAKTHAPRPFGITSMTHAHGADGREGERPASVATITGYACGCPDTSPPTTPGVVLDPFGGTGTTALMAKALGRDGISVDLSTDYCRLAEWRTTNPGQLAAALQVDKPAPVDPDQLDLFGGVA